MNHLSFITYRLSLIAYHLSLITYHLSLHIRYHLAECVDDFFFPDTLLDDDEDGVVAGDGAQYFVYVVVVDVVGDGTGIAGTCLDDAHVAREMNAQEPGDLQHLLHRVGRGDALVHRVVG